MLICDGGLRERKHCGNAAWNSPRRDNKVYCAVAYVVEQNRPMLLVGPLPYWLLSTLYPTGCANRIHKFPSTRAMNAWSNLFHASRTPPWKTFPRLTARRWHGTQNGERHKNGKTFYSRMPNPLSFFSVWKLVDPILLWWIWSSAVAILLYFFQWAIKAKHRRVGNNRKRGERRLPPTEHTNSIFFWTILFI